MIQIIETRTDQLIAAKIEGKISKSDVEQIHSLIHKVEKGKKVNFYFEMHDFHGYELKGLYEDLKVDALHLSDYGKIAIIGENKWQEWTAKIMGFFTSSDVKYFETIDKEQAMAWVNK
ncbi:SpoIIAA family protein [Frigoriflavimonas asaccharolytica]|uniref:SpoIIAA-like protein n=1 Tax=Frigoriflavimonas asaccharolytica TaxID=2735899 RepID=A0A8J8KCL7_9FLAO|nr:STAS/SEC14 domain-containing protein [Frigoriflavimonas asaccharolytica]NRS93784.1 hypothetical protein [Frigoriflavimonas asaccharolytica]